MFDYLELQKTLVAAALPSGHEKAVGEVLAELARPFVDEVFVDTLGSVICHKKGPGARLAIPAHMDVIGFMATSIDQNGFVHYAPIGGHRPHLLPGTRVRFEGGACGVMMADDKAGLNEKAMNRLTQTYLYIDIGARDRAEAERMVKIGEVCTFDAQTTRVAGDRVMTPYGDDLAACCVLLMAMEQMGESKNDLYFIFTVQEEVGLRGAIAAANRYRPDMCIACDLCYTGDSPEDEQMMAVSLGKGPTVKLMDSSLICSPQTVAHLLAAAGEKGIAVQREILTGGGTDSGGMQLTTRGVLSGCVSIPARNVHSCCELMSEQDIRGAAALIAAAAEREIILG